MSLRYELTVKDFTCPECGEYSDEISQITENIMDDSITALCCDTELWRYDLEVEGYNVTEVIHASQRVAL